MPVLRPTFHEAWHRVEGLRPRLRTGITVSRQHFRGQVWHVLEDPAANQYFRLNAPGYALVGLLDGRRTVGQAWVAAGDRLGDEAPTQGEAIRLLGQLYNSSLLSAEVPDDTRTLLRRYRQRRTRRIQGGLWSVLSFRIPLVDPDRFLGLIAGPLGWLYSLTGLVLWLLWVIAGLAQLAGRGGELLEQSARAVSPAHLPILLVVFLVCKLIHELSHGLACKVLARREGREGPVHTMGLMLLVLLPAPYVDASSAWSLRSKWSRVVVGAAGMMAELAIAALAAWIWNRTAAGSALNDAAYSALLVAGVSTVVFNANPLLRYDGYYILSDLLEIPNLQQRSQSAMHDLVKRHLWRIPRLAPPIGSPIDRTLLVLFGAISAVYRVLVSVAVVLFVGGQFFIIGAAIALIAIAAWGVAPAASLVRYLASAPELERVRRRAILTTTLFAAAIVGALGLVPVPERIRLEGVVEPEHRTTLRMPAPGTVAEAPPSGASIGSAGVPLIRAENLVLAGEGAALNARAEGAEARVRRAMAGDPAIAQIERQRLGAVRDQAERVRQQRESLRIRAPHAGIWIVKDERDLPGRFFARGDPLGELVDLSRVVIRAAAGQDAAAVLDSQYRSVELRVTGRAGAPFPGTVIRVVEAATQRAPVGEPTPGGEGVGREEPIRERAFEVFISPEDPSAATLLPGQRVAVRATVGRRPLLAQWWSDLGRIFQRRLEVPR